MNHKECIEVLRKDLEGTKEQLARDGNGDPLNYFRDKIQALTYAISCLERVDEEKIEKIINEHCQGIINKDKVMLVYGNVAHVITEFIQGGKG